MNTPKAKFYAEVDIDADIVHECPLCGDAMVLDVDEEDVWRCAACSLVVRFK